VNLNLTLIGQLIAFTIFVIFCMKYVWPPISGALADRQKKIAEGLDAADKAARDLETAKSQIEGELKKSAFTGNRAVRAGQQKIVTDR
jgi:F-type H+-transporting ATPase subunit b